MNRKSIACARLPMAERLEVRRLFSTSFFVSTNASAVTPADGVRLSSVQEVNALDLNPGDRVLFAAGETFTAALSFSAQDSGSPDPGGTVALGSFDAFTGLETAARAVLQNAAGSALTATDVHDFAVHDLTLSGGNWQTNGGDGISFLNDLSGNIKLANISLTNLDVGQFGAAVTTPKHGAATASGGWGIRVGGTTGKSGFANVLIQDVAVHDNERGGIEIYGVFNAASTLYANQNVTLRRVSATYNRGIAGFTAKHTGSGIIVSDTDGALVERSIAAYNGQLNFAVGGPVGIWAWDSNRVTIQKNESHHNHTGSTADGGGFDLDGGTTNSVLEYNYSHDNDGAGFGLFQFSGARAFKNNVVRYNISANDGRKNNYAGVQLWNGGSGISNVDIYNNTVHVTPAAGAAPRAIYLQSAATNVRIRNNIFQTTGGVRLVEIVPKTSGAVFQGNLYWSSGAAFSIRDSTSTFTSLDAWRAKGQEKLNGVATGYSIDPALAAPSAYPTLNDAGLLESMTSFRLQSTSPAVIRNGGLDLAALFGTNNGGFDFFGEAAPDGGYSIGADDSV